MAINFNSKLAPVETMSPLDERFRTKPESEQMMVDVAVSKSPANDLDSSAGDMNHPENAQKLIDEANRLMEKEMEQSERRITFQKDEDSGRVLIHIREKIGEETTTRQIPPQSFLKMLRQLREGGVSLGGKVEEHPHLSGLLDASA